jgi:Domain of unknown function (DUF397)
VQACGARPKQNAAAPACRTRRRAITKHTTAHVTFPPQVIKYSQSTRLACNLAHGRSGGNGGQRVEVACSLPGVVAVRDSKDPDGAKLVFTHEQWAAFTAG